MYIQKSWLIHLSALSANRVISAQMSLISKSERHTYIVSSNVYQCNRRQSKNMYIFQTPDFIENRINGKKELSNKQGPCWKLWFPVYYNAIKWYQGNMGRWSRLHYRLNGIVTLKNVQWRWCTTPPLKPYQLSKQHDGVTLFYLYWVVCYCLLVETHLLYTVELCRLCYGINAPVMIRPSWNVITDNLVFPGRPYMLIE